MINYHVIANISNVLWTVYTWITECGQAGSYKIKIPPIHIIMFDITLTLLSLGDCENCHSLL